MGDLAQLGDVGRRQNLAILIGQVRQSGTDGGRQTPVGRGEERCGRRAAVIGLNLKRIFVVIAKAVG